MKVGAEQHILMKNLIKKVYLAKKYNKKLNKSRFK